MSASRPMVGTKAYHLMAGPGDVAPYVLTPGDPDRVPRIAKYWDSARAVATHREYVTYTGTYKGAPNIGGIHRYRRTGGGNSH